MLRIEPYGVVFYHQKTCTTLRFDKKEAGELFRVSEFPNQLSAPEFVHLEISDKCNLNCSYCYHETKQGRELSTKQWKKIIRDLAENRIFQLTFGGGEPTLREDLIELASLVRGLGMNLAMTSNGVLIDRFSREDLKHFNQINISFHGDERILGKTLNYLRGLDIPRGINFCLRKSYLNKLNWAIGFAKAFDAQLLLLSYKPVIGNVEEVIPSKEVFAIAQAIYGKFKIRVAVDGMTAGKCFAAERFVDVNPEGDVYVCSFIREPVGNLTKEKFAEIWGKRQDKIDCPYLQEGRF